MAIIRQDHNQKWEYQDGVRVLIEDEVVDVDVTAEVTEGSLYSKLRTQYGINRTFIQTPNANITNADAVNQIKRLSGQLNALMRIAAPELRDLLMDETVD